MSVGLVLHASGDTPRSGPVQLGRRSPVLHQESRPQRDGMPANAQTEPQPFSESASARAGSIRRDPTMRPPRGVRPTACSPARSRLPSRTRRVCSARRTSAAVRCTPRHSRRHRRSIQWRTAPRWRRCRPAERAYSSGCWRGCGSPSVADRLFGRLRGTDPRLPAPRATGIRTLGGGASDCSPLCEIDSSYGLPPRSIESGATRSIR